MSRLSHMQVFSRLLPPFVSAYALQTAAAALFVPQQNELYYDLCGALGYLSTTCVSLFWHTQSSRFAPRQLLITAALTIWSARLGTFLFTRAIKAGGDSRFDEIKRQPRKFTYFWMAQATWVFIVGLPVYLCNIAPAPVHPPLGIRDYVSIGLFAGSFIWEVVADAQKSSWKRKKEAKQHDEKFISSGLWSLSRHPNYIGEIGIWAGIWGLSTRALQTPHFPRGTVALAALSPLFTYFLLRYVSGVPPLERVAKKRFVGDPKYDEYEKRVPVFWPWW